MRVRLHAGKGDVDSSGAIPHLQVGGVGASEAGRNGKGKRVQRMEGDKGLAGRGAVNRGDGEVSGGAGYVRGWVSGGGCVGAGCAANVSVSSNAESKRHTGMN